MNSQGLSLGCFRDSCHRQLACPSIRAAGVGVGPTSRRSKRRILPLDDPANHVSRELRRQELNLRGTRLTDARNYQQLPLRNRVGAVGFEPGHRREAVVLLLPEQAELPGFPTRRCKSAQRESNPHIRHGKAVGCRYIMGACFIANSIVKDRRAPGRTRTGVAALRVRNLGR